MKFLPLSALLFALAVTGTWAVPVLKPDLKPDVTTLRTTLFPPEATTSRTTLFPPESTTAGTPVAALPKGETEYCKCDVDKDKFAKGWSYNEIWLDIVVILDTSETMGEKGLERATGLLESLISDGVDDNLITDTNSKFYTRVGVISMSDKPKVLYNLNMTKADTVKVQIAKGVTELDVLTSFSAAVNMLDEGVKAIPEREKARQVIYYMTDADPKNAMDAVNQFKASRGVIVVNHFIQEGERERPKLKELASTGFYTTADHYLPALQTLCRANCFCLPFRHDHDASTGCFHNGPMGIPYNKAKMSCAKGDGILATVHSEKKGRFVRDLVSNFTKTPIDHFWIGYDRTVDGQWRWSDQSNDNYTNWGANEPSQDENTKCARVDMHDHEMPWSAGNCKLGLPYLCQYRPCSVGWMNCTTH